MSQFIDQEILKLNKLPGKSQKNLEDALIEMHLGRLRMELNTMKRLQILIVEGNRKLKIPVGAGALLPETNEDALAQAQRFDPLFTSESI